MKDSTNSLRHNRTALILYGSETGNSQDVAEELGRVAERLLFKTRVTEMDLVAINELLNYDVVVFSISTTGQGEFPKNSRKFWKSLLRKRLPPGCLDHVAFTTFGLGDSSYPKFNWSARKLHKRLEQLGANEVYPRGEADEQHEEGIDGSFLSWSADFRKHLLSSYPLPDGVEPLSSDSIPPFKYRLALVSDPEQAPDIKMILSANDIGMDPRDRPVFDQNLAEEAFPLERRPVPPLKEASEAPDIDKTVPPMNFISLPTGTEMELIGNVRMTPPEHWQDVRKLTFLTKKFYCRRPGREAMKPEDVYHDKLHNCGLRCGEHCRGKCSTCPGKCTGECEECMERYHPGDIVTIYPKNFPEDVDKLIEIMGWEDVAEKKVALCFTHDIQDRVPVSNVPGLNASPECTFRELLIHNLDFNAIPHRYFFTLISNYTKDPLHKERLIEFGNPAHRDEYFDYATRPRRSIFEVLQDFAGSVMIPWSEITNIFPVIRGRQFSIASGGSLKDSGLTGLKQAGLEGMVKVELVIALVKYRTILKKIRQGLCSRYIASLTEGTMVKVQFDVNKKFDILAHSRPDLPIIMIAPGTGIAPCRSLIWEHTRYRALRADQTAEVMQKRNLIEAAIDIERVHKDREVNSEGKRIAYDAPQFGDMILFYGNRSKDADYLFKEEWKIAELRLEVHTAFSRDQRQKIYVQDVLLQQSKRVYDLLSQNAIIYVCGSSGNMPKSVRATILKIIEKEAGFSPEESEACVAAIEAKGAYIQETW